MKSFSVPLPAAILGVALLVATGGLQAKTFKPEPMLATAWNQVSPTQLRLTLRSGVKFHDGADFTAGDEVFPLQRAMAPTSNQVIPWAKVKSINVVHRADNRLDGRLITIN